MITLPLVMILCERSLIVRTAILPIIFRVEDDSLSDDSDDSVTTIEMPLKSKDNSSKPKESSLKELGTIPVEKPSKPKKPVTKEPTAGKTNSEPKPKKKEKKSKSERKVGKKKSKDILEDESRKLLDTVEQKKPFTDDKLHLIADNLARLAHKCGREHNKYQNPLVSPK